MNLVCNSGLRTLRENLSSFLLMTPLNTQFKSGQECCSLYLGCSEAPLLCSYRNMRLLSLPYKRRPPHGRCSWNYAELSASLEPAKARSSVVRTCSPECWRCSLLLPASYLELAMLPGVLAPPHIALWPAGCVSTQILQAVHLLP